MYSLTREPTFKMWAVINAKGLFDALSAKDVGKLVDKSTLLYVLAYREAIHRRRIAGLHWWPTEAMIVDELTKDMEPNGTWEQFYATGEFGPWNREDLPEDYVTFNSETGETTRWRVGT